MVIKWLLLKGARFSIPFDTESSLGIHSIDAALAMYRLEKPYDKRISGSCGLEWLSFDYG